MDNKSRRKNNNSKKKETKRKKPYNKKHKKCGKGIHSNRATKINRQAKKFLTRKREKEKYDEKIFLITKAMNRFEQKQEITIPFELRQQMGLIDSHGRRPYHSLDLSIPNIESWRYIVTAPDAKKIIDEYFYYFSSGKFIDNIKQYKKSLTVKNRKKFIKNRFKNVTNEMNRFIKKLFRPYEDDPEFFDELIEEMNNFPGLQLYLSRLNAYNTLDENSFFPRDIFDVLDLENNRLLRNGPWYVFYGLLMSIFDDLDNNVEANDSAYDPLYEDDDGNRFPVTNLKFLNKMQVFFNLNTDAEIQNKIDELIDIKDMVDEYIFNYISIIEKKVYHLFEYDTI